MPVWKPQGHRDYSIFASQFSVMRDNSSGFFISNFYTLDKKILSNLNFETFEYLGENSPNSFFFFFYNNDDHILQTNN